MKRYSPLFHSYWRSSVLLILLITSSAERSVAQASEYSSQMTQLLSRLDTTRSTAGREKVAQAFAELAQTEKTQWLPYYYAAYTLTRAVLDDDDSRIIDSWTSRAACWLDTAEGLRADPSEVAVMRAMILYARIPVNYALRAYPNLTQAQKQLEKALSHNPDNPRAYLLLGQRAYRAPEGFGGNKEEALRHFENSLALYGKQLSTAQAVSWGRSTALQLAAACREQLTSTP